ncbi:MAG TPA: gamma-glutamyltransferase family protein [Allosphingosinicella sp.]|nr:gamma-glutamyltransferase family protein [Allosphingosinicella sp.]
MSYLNPLRLAFPLLLLAACAIQPVNGAPVAAAARSGIVSAADPRAAEAGRAILNAGGSAADAALATMLALTVVEPQSSGIGGGSFLVHHDEAAGSIASYDGREQAPAAATPNLFLGPDGKPLPFGEAMPGGKSVGVPGNLRLAALAHQRHGRLPWARLFEPAIRLARDGFAITPRMHAMLAGRAAHAGMTGWARAQFFGADGEPRPVGTVIRNPELARLYESLAARGADYFYVGPPAHNLVRAVTTAARNPSAMTLGDLATYDAKERPVLCGEYRRHRVCGMGPPSSGATTVFAILKQLERFEMAAMRPDDPAAWHLIAESMRLAYADREAYIGDPDHVRVPTRGLMDPAYLAARSRLISRERAMPSVAAGAPPGAPRVTAAADGEVPSTSHFVAADAAGNVASMTSTIESVWGSGLTVDGYFLNNELTDFSFAPARDGAPVANRVEGGKRPRSSMSPTIVYGPDGEVRIAVGAAGGPTIIAQVAKALIGVIDWKLSAQEAIALPQIVAIGDSVTVERGTALEAMIPALAALGHRVVATDPGFKANAAERVGGRWRGAADPRSEGVALAQ